uniref:Uncharacterized protein n=1 Tax=Eutreptiella gymnastica TaxID=73025 RepID=A0A7S1IP85_9EUGL|mmetsp:Transcript_31308/g.56255  ORF Transcript_31308/g.56255 Transcript_31308/m.56255 type:complete len:1126 (+) Transcript_31308:140-3517(+)
MNDESLIQDLLAEIQAEEASIRWQIEDECGEAYRVEMALNYWTAIVIIKEEESRQTIEAARLNRLFMIWSGYLNSWEKVGTQELHEAEMFDRSVCESQEDESRMQLEILFMESLAGGLGHMDAEFMRAAAAEHEYLFENAIKGAIVLNHERERSAGFLFAYARRLGVMTEEIAAWETLWAKLDSCLEDCNRRVRRRQSVHSNSTAHAESLQRSKIEAEELKCRHELDNVFEELLMMYFAQQSSLEFIREQSVQMTMDREVMGYHVAQEEEQGRVFLQCWSQYLGLIGAEVAGWTSLQSVCSSAIAASQRSADLGRKEKMLRTKLEADAMSFYSQRRPQFRRQALQIEERNARLQVQNQLASEQREVDKRAYEAQAVATILELAEQESLARGQLQRLLVEETEVMARQPFAGEEATERAGLCLQEHCQAEPLWRNLVLEEEDDIRINVLHEAQESLKEHLEELVQHQAMLQRIAKQRRRSMAVHEERLREEQRRVEEARAQLLVEQDLSLATLQYEEGCQAGLLLISLLEGEQWCVLRAQYEPGHQCIVDCLERMQSCCAKEQGRRQDLDDDEGRARQDLVAQILNTLNEQRQRAEAEAEAEKQRAEAEKQRTDAAAQAQQLAALARQLETEEQASRRPIYHEASIVGLSIQGLVSKVSQMCCWAGLIGVLRQEASGRGPFLNTEAREWALLLANWGIETMECEEEDLRYTIQQDEGEERQALKKEEAIFHANVLEVLQRRLQMEAERDAARMDELTSQEVMLRKMLEKEEAANRRELRRNEGSERSVRQKEDTILRLQKKNRLPDVAPATRLSPSEEFDGFVPSIQRGCQDESFLWLETEGSSSASFSEATDPIFSPVMHQGFDAPTRRGSVDRMREAITRMSLPSISLQSYSFGTDRPDDSLERAQSHPGRRTREYEPGLDEGDKGQRRSSKTKQKPVVKDGKMAVPTDDPDLSDHSSQLRPLKLEKRRRRSSANVNLDRRESAEDSDVSEGKDIRKKEKKSHRRRSSTRGVGSGDLDLGSSREMDTDGTPDEARRKPKAGRRRSEAMEALNTLDHTPIPPPPDPAGNAHAVPGRRSRIRGNDVNVDHLLPSNPEPWEGGVVPAPHPPEAPHPAYARTQLGARG